MSGGRSSRTVLVRALGRHAERSVEQGRRAAQYAVVRQVNPLQIELTQHRLLLTEDDLVISQWVRRYGYDYGLKVGDTVLVSHMPNDDFVVHDVISTGKAEEGIDNSVDQIVASGDPTWSGADPQGGSVTVTANHHIAKKQPVRDVNGTIIGWVPVYTSLP